MALNPNNPRGPYKKRPLEERIEKKTCKSSHCWTWTGSTTPLGYGEIHANGKTRLVHRLAWELSAGRSLAKGECVLHSCDNPPCVNPNHLWIGTKAENSADMARKGRGGRAKLTPDDIREIRNSAASQRELGRIYGVSRFAISSVLSGKTWRHVK